LFNELRSSRHVHHLRQPNIHRVSKWRRNLYLTFTWTRTRWRPLTVSRKPVGVVGYVSAADREGDALRGDGKRFVVRADEKLTAFVELESASRALRLQ
jgi:hypothetical protein